MLVEQVPLDERFRDHALIGDWKGFRECHIQPDWLLIYRIEGDELQLARTGSHAQLFG
jgi:mRNA interferase YafQ